MTLVRRESVNLLPAQYVDVHDPWVLTSSDRLGLWNWETGETVQLSDDVYYFAFFFPDGKHFVAVGRTTITVDGLRRQVHQIQVWNLDTRRMVTSLNVENKILVPPHQAFACASNGAFILFLDGLTLKQWFWQTNDPVRVLGNEIVSVALTHDDQFIYVKTLNQLQKRPMGEDRVVWHDENQWLNAIISLSPDDEGVAVLEMGSYASKCKWYQHGQHMLTEDLDDRYYDLMWSPRGDYILAQSTYQTQLWNVTTRTWQPIKLKNYMSSGLTWTSDGRMLVGIARPMGLVKVVFYDVDFDQPLTPPDTQSVEHYYCQHLRWPAINERIQALQNKIQTDPNPQLVLVLVAMLNEKLEESTQNLIDRLPDGPMVASREMTYIYQDWIRPIWDGYSPLEILVALKELGQCGERSCQQLITAHDQLQKVCRHIAEQLEKGRQADLRQVLPDEQKVPAFNQVDDSYAQIPLQNIQTPSVFSERSVGVSEEKRTPHPAPYQPRPVPSSFPVSEPYLRPGNPYATIHPEHGPPVWTRNPGPGTGIINRTLQSEDPDVDRIVRELEGQEVDDPQSEAERLRAEYVRRQTMKRQRKAARGVKRVRRVRKKK